MQRSLRRGRQINFLVAVGAAAMLMGAQAWAISPETTGLGATQIGGATQSGAAATVSPQPGRTVVDEAGLRVTIPAKIERIVTLAPNLTETIYDLGLEDKLVGDTTYCDTPVAAKNKPHVGPPMNPSVEAIVALRPDLVLATTSINFVDTVTTLSRLGIAVYSTDPHTVREMLDSVTHIADVAGAPEKGAALEARLQARLDALHARLETRPLVHVLFVVWEDPLISIGQNTFIADALRWAGAESAIVTRQNWPQLGMEEVVRVQPDYIVLTSDHAGTNDDSIANLQSRPTWKELRAVELGHVVVTGEEFTRPSPGLVGEIEKLARQLHPEAFDNAGAAERGALRLPAQANAIFAEECKACAR
ncbi:MAG: ABC transporter substrate-binding protein [Candidatus Acidiferrales bacterium]